jgi:hypothetical protein
MKRPPLHRFWLWLSEHIARSQAYEQKKTWPAIRGHKQA